MGRSMERDNGVLAWAERPCGDTATGATQVLPASGAGAGDELRGKGGDMLGTAVSETTFLGLCARDPAQVQPTRGNDYGATEVEWRTFGGPPACG